MGLYEGGQAQYLRVPYADFNCLKLPLGTEHEADFALLADIFPTGWHGLVLSGFQPGEPVTVFGAGPVGLMAACSATLRGLLISMLWIKFQSALLRRRELAAYQLILARVML
jgi:threonine dehydrogenase-like Zn-dependent dehydrogenase